MTVSSGEMLTEIRLVLRPLRFCVLVLLLIVPLPFPASVAARSLEEGDATSEDVSYANGETALAATVWIPPGQGPFPGVVFVHGSGSSSRSNPWTSAYATALVDRGIAVLYPDKRGSGASGGDWREATFLTLADDAIAALDLLRAYPAVDSSRVGLIGFSQGGDIVPLAATRSSHVSFVINVSGSVVPMMEQISDELRQMGEHEGLTETQLGTIQSLHELAVHYALTGQGWEAYAGTLQEAKEGTLQGTEVIEGFPTESGSPSWGFLRTIANFDPLPYWREVSVPALFLYGGRDENVDVYKSARIIEDSLTQSTLTYSLLLFRNNGHGLFREDAMDFIARWIRDGGMD